MIRNEKVLDDINALLDYDSIKDYLYMNWYYVKKKDS